VRNVQRKGQWMLAAALAATGAMPGFGQQQSRGIDVESYKIDVQVNPSTQSIAATAQVTFLPLDDNTTAVSFELNNALNLTKVTDAAGHEVSSTREPKDSTVRLQFGQPIAKGSRQTVTFAYDGRLTGQEESPVPGIKFASVQKDYAYLTYPARWFPISGYTADRYTAEVRVTVPAGFRAVSSGIEKKDSGAGGSTIYSFQQLKPSFPGSVAIVQGEPQRISAQGVTSDIWFRGDDAAMAKPFGEELGKVMTYLTSLYGLPPVSNLLVVETDSGAPNGYSAPGMLFLSPNGIGKQPSQRLLANQLTRQWFGGLFSPVNRNHLWIVNGMAKYAEVLYQESLNGPSVLEAEVKDFYVDALTVREAPMRQAARFEDYSPELFAITGSKGAAVLHMLRGVIGDAAFQKALKSVSDQFAYKSISTDDFRKAFETASDQQLQGFFVQWTESTGSPEFTMEYTIFRTQKGFRVMGKIAQDLDTFRMPVDLKIETEGNPEMKKVDVVGTSSEFVVETFGKPKKVIIDPDGRVLRMSPQMRVAVAIRRGEQLAEVGDYAEALKEYQKALEVTRVSSLAHYRVAEVFFLQGNYQSAAKEFRESLNGDLDPKWTEVWSHIFLGKIFDISQQRDRARNEYTQAIRTKDNTQGAQEEAARYVQKPYERLDKN
jgi:aminopeptidase N